MVINESHHEIGAQNSEGRSQIRTAAAINVHCMSPQSIAVSMQCEGANERAGIMCDQLNAIDLHRRNMIREISDGPMQSTRRGITRSEKGMGNNTSRR